MNLLLLRKLIDKEIIKYDTEIDASYSGGDISGSPMVQTLGSFTIVRIYDRGEDGIELLGANTSDGTRRIISADHVTKIDGMDPIRLAGIFGLSDTGEPLRQGKRRGRKPRIKALS